MKSLFYPKIFVYHTLNTSSVHPKKRKDHFMLMFTHACEFETKESQWYDQKCGSQTMRTLCFSQCPAVSVITHIEKPNNQQISIVLIHYSDFFIRKQNNDWVCQHSMISISMCVFAQFYNALIKIETDTKTTQNGTQNEKIKKHTQKYQASNFFSALFR